MSSERAGAERRVTSLSEWLNKMEDIVGQQAATLFLEESLPAGDVQWLIDTQRKTAEECETLIAELRAAWAREDKAATDIAFFKSAAVDAENKALKGFGDSNMEAYRRGLAAARAAVVAALGADAIMPVEDNACVIAIDALAAGAKE